MTPKIVPKWLFSPLPDITIQELAVIVGWIIHSTRSDHFIERIETAPANIQRHFQKRENKS